MNTYTMEIDGELTLDELRHFGRIAFRYGFPFDSTVTFDGDYLTVAGETDV